MDNASNILTHMRNIYNNRKLCDVILVAGIDGKRIHAHRFLLSASSQYFLEMFTGSNKESMKNNEIMLPSIQGDVLEKLVDYCYTGHIELCENLLEQLYMTAELWQLNFVVEACAFYLVRRLQAIKFMDATYFTDEQNCQKLRRRAYAYAGENFMTLCNSAEFLRLNIQELSDLIARDDLYIKTEELIFNSVIAWIEHDLDERQKYISKLLLLVRLSYLKSSFITERVKPICILHKCEWQPLADRQAAKIIKPRIYQQLIVAINHLDINNIGYMQFYEPNLDKWTAWSNKPTELQNVCAITASNENIFIIGTCKHNQVCIFTFNIIECSWSQSKPMQIYRKDFCAAIIGRYIYVIGGRCIKDNPVDIVERFDTLKNHWRHVTPLPTQTFNASVAIMDDCLYVVGGCNNLVMCNMVECYNPKTNEWTTKASMHYSGMYATVGNLNGVLYAFGTYNIFGTCDTSRTYFERYDKKFNQWTVIFQTIIDLRTLSCVLYETKFLLIHSAGNLFSFDPIENKLEQKAPLIYSSTNISSAIIPNMISQLF